MNGTATQNGRSLRSGNTHKRRRYPTMPAARTRQTSKQAPSSPSKEPRRRAPRRCRRCDGAPLLSECSHGRRKDKTAAPAPEANVPPPPALEAGQSTPQEGTLIPPPLGLSSTPPPLHASTTPVTTAEASPNIAPNVIEASEATLAVNTDSAPINTDSTPVNSPQKTPRVFPSNANPIHGTIKGLCRGNEKAVMSRTREIKPVFVETGKAQTFCEYNLRDLFTRVESLAEATGAWAYLAIQHPWSRSPFLHWTSRKLRREAPDDVQQLHKSVSRLMSQVKRADRARFMELIRTNDANEESLRAAEQRAVQAELEAELLRDQLNERESTLEARERVIAALLSASNPSAVPPTVVGGSATSA